MHCRQLHATGAYLVPRQEGLGKRKFSELAECSQVFKYMYAKLKRPVLRVLAV